MPIVFAPPDALDAEAFAGLGRNEARAQAAQIAARREAALLGAQSDFFRTAIASGAQRADAGNMQAQLEQRQHEFREAVAQRDRLAQLESQTQLAAIDRRGQVQAFLQSMDPGYQEELQYQQDAQEISAIESDRTLTRFEKDQLISQRMTGVKMSRQRLDESRARQQQELANREMEQADRMAKMARHDDEVRANPLMGVHDLPDGGKYVYQGGGKWAYVPKPKEEGMADNFGRTPAQVQTAIANVQQRVDAFIQADKEFRIKNELPEKQWDRSSLIQQEIIEQEEILRRQFGGRTQQTPGGAQVQSQQGEPPPKKLTPEEELAEAEKRVENLKKNVTYIESLNKQLDRLPDQVGGEFKPKLGFARGLLEQFGSAEAMPPDVRQEYTAVVHSIVRALMESREPARKAEPPRREGFTSLKHS